MIDLSKAWSTMTCSIIAAQNPWSLVKGPVGATIANLYDLGWNPISPFK